jgi:hypothetical protein
MATPIDHISLSVPHPRLESYITFLNAALAPFGIKELFRIVPEVIAFGADPNVPWLWVASVENREHITEEEWTSGKGRRVHLALRAKGKLDAVFACRGAVDIDG